MSVPANPADPPMAEPGKRPTGSDDRGGKAAPGSTPAASARAERPASDDGATSAGDAKLGSGSGATGARPNRNDDEEEEWRHEPVAPVDEPNPLRSLGKAVGDTVTGSDQDAPAPSKR